MYLGYKDLIRSNSVNANYLGLKKMNIRITLFSSRYKKEVASISEKEMGKNFINEEYLNFFLDNPNAQGIVALVNDEVVGFSFFQWCVKDELSKYIFVDQGWLKEIFKNVDLIGYRNLTAVKKEFQGRGIGSKLVDNSIEELKKRAEVIANVVWKAPGSKNLGKALERHGLKRVKTIRGYWREDSLKRKYECAACGLPPCRCTAEIYISESE